MFKGKKKLKAAIVAVALEGVGGFIMPEQQDTFHSMALALMAYVVGQGAADIGKEAQKT